MSIMQPCAKFFHATNLFHCELNISPGSMVVQTKVMCQSLKLVSSSFVSQNALVCSHAEVEALKTGSTVW